MDPLTDPHADLTNLGSWHNPIAPTGPGRLVSAAAFVAHVPLSLVATAGVIAQLVSRWRHGDPFRRQQLTLFAAAAVLPVVAAPIALGWGAGGWIFGTAALPLTFAIGFAVLARGLYDLRTAANRTLVWLTLSAVVAGAFALVIAGTGGLLGIDRSTRWLPWAAAAVIAVTFAPLRDSLQRAVNRLTFGRWDEPYDVLAAVCSPWPSGPAPSSGIPSPSSATVMHSRSPSASTVSRILDKLQVADRTQAALYRRDHEPPRGRGL